jgi:hypothetical protein
VAATCPRPCLRHKGVSRQRRGPSAPSRQPDRRLAVAPTARVRSRPRCRPDSPVDASVAVPIARVAAARLQSGRRRRLHRLCPSKSPCVHRREEGGAFENSTAFPSPAPPIRATDLPAQRCRRARSLTLGPSWARSWAARTLRRLRPSRAWLGHLRAVQAGCVDTVQLGRGRFGPVADDLFFYFLNIFKSL